MGQVADEISEPVELQFTLPDSATLHAVAYQDPATGQLLQADSRFENGTVTLTTPTGHFHIEFYDAALAIDGASRSYRLDWSSPYPVETLVYQMQQPPTSSVFSSEPAAQTTLQDEFGLNMAVWSVEEVAAGEMLGISLSYSKSDSNLTADVLAPPGGAGAPNSAGAPSGAAQPAGPAPAQAAAGGMSPLAVIVLVVGVSAFVGVAVYLLSTGRIKIVNDSEPSQPPSRKGQSKTAANPRFCTKCGASLRTDDKFCRECGQPVGRNTARA
ncbi:MAG: zinc ribbon domain-containing protein [Chloroflexi bacterium]|nr:zinc ribbon domain-containing protein [Chloroflexota bacterium]